MLDVALIGGGLCGLALAHSLQARHIGWSLFEARPRLGGRVLTAHASNGVPLDLGPAWYWPATQPSITRLVADLGLASLAQPDDGRVLLLDDPNRAPQAHAFDAGRATLVADPAVPATPGTVHGGARRLVGGMAALTDALAERLPAAQLQCGVVLQALIDHGSHVELQLLRDGEPLHLLARRAVLCLPPRLAASSLRFTPALPADVLAAMAATPTWMAGAAKALVACGSAPWRQQPATGNAWVTHPQAVLAEVFDTGPPTGPDGAAPGAALAGFVALGAAQRPAFRRGLPMLVESQLAMLFGHGVADGELQLQDWADEPFTSSPADRDDDQASGHPVYGEPALQQGLWQGRLWLGGSETARHGGGYLEGALAAAARLRTRLGEAANDGSPTAPATAPTTQPEGA